MVENLSAQLTQPATEHGLSGGSEGLRSKSRGAAATGGGVGGAETALAVQEV